MDLTFLFPFFSWVGWGWAPFETLNLFHAYLFYDSAGHRVYTESATSGLDNLLRINQAPLLTNLISLHLFDVFFVSLHRGLFYRQLISIHFLLDIFAKCFF